MSANIVIRFLGKNPTTIFLQKPYNVFQRTICASTQNRFYLNETKTAAATATVKKLDWKKAMSEAEKIVGYPTSFLSLRWLLSDEIANVALHLRKLVGSNHPLLQTAKNIFNGHNNTQAFGLIVLLISKAAGHLHVNHIEEDKSAGVLHSKKELLSISSVLSFFQCETNYLLKLSKCFSQRALAEVTEMMRTSYLIHKGMINTDETIGTEINHMLFGNKIALLSGDYLLSTTCCELAVLRNQDLVYLMSCAVRDIFQSDFVTRIDDQSHFIPSIPPKDRTGYALKEWTLLNFLRTGSLLGCSCQGTLKLAGHSDEIQKEGYKFGKHLSLAWQAYLDLALCINKDEAILHNLCAAPIMFHIEHDPSILIELEKGLKSVNDVDYLKVLEIVADGPGIELTKDLLKEHSQRAIEVLNVFKENEAKKALSNIITALGGF